MADRENSKNELIERMSVLLLVYINTILPAFHFCGGVKLVKTISFCDDIKSILMFVGPIKMTTYNDISNKIETNWTN